VAPPQPQHSADDPPPYAHRAEVAGGVFGATQCATAYVTAAGHLKELVKRNAGHQTPHGFKRLEVMSGAAQAAGLGSPKQARRPEAGAVDSLPARVLAIAASQASNWRGLGRNTRKPWRGRPWSVN